MLYSDNMDWILLVADVGTFKGDVWLALFLYVSITVFAWAKGKLGSPEVAILYTIIMMFLVFYQHDVLIWMALGLYLYQTYGKEIFKG